MKLKERSITRFSVYLVLLLLFSTQIFATTIDTKENNAVHTRITDQIIRLSELGTTPIVFGKDLSVFHNDFQLMEYLKSYVPIKNFEDLYEIFYNQVAFLQGVDSVNKELPRVYDIFFNGSWMPEDIKITVFSGGTGSNRLANGLLDYTDRIDMLINAYDDLEGTSNGSIRREFNVLGPSDIIKNLVALLDESYVENTALKNLLEYRLPKDEDLGQLRYDLEVVAKNGNVVQDKTLFKLVSSLTPKYREIISNSVEGFLQKVRKWESIHETTFDLRDYAVRNIVYTGLLFIENYQHKEAIETFKQQFHVKPNIVLNNDEGLWLVGLTSGGNLLNSEGDICKSCLNEEVDDVFIWPSLLSEKEQQEFYSFETTEEKKLFLESNSVPIVASDEAKESIHSAQMILFAPTTFYSNIVPTLKTSGVRELLQRSNAIKIHVANLTLERGKKILSQQLEDLQYFLSYRNIGDGGLDYVIANLPDYNTEHDPSFILVDRDRIRHLGLELIELSVADQRQIGLHRSDVTSKVVMQLQALDRAGYVICEGRCRKKNSDRDYVAFSKMTELERVQFRKKMQDRLEEYLENTYHAIFVDVDGTITDSSKEVPESVFSMLHEYISKGILIGINTARTDASLEKKLLLPLSKYLNQKPEFLKRVYVYSNNGAHGYTLDGRTLYAHKISPDIASLATRHIRDELLNADEACIISPYKITILPNDDKNPIALVCSINELLNKNSFPYIARLGADPKSRPSIIITAHRMNKRRALFDFVQHSSIPIDAIIKIGDKGALDGVDNDWLIGKGSFSVEEFDENGTHVPLLLLEGQKGLAGTMWIFERVILQPRINSEL